MRRLTPCLLIVIVLCLTACGSSGLAFLAPLPDKLKAVPELPLLPDPASYTVLQRDLLLIDYERYSQTCHDRLEAVVGLR